MRKLLVFVIFCAFAALSLGAQSPLSGGGGDPAAYIGMTVTDLIRNLGVPESVYPVRGVEEWQDDVVFSYDEGDFYILKDRVWQLGLKAAYHVSLGDPVSAAFLQFGEARFRGPDYAIFSINEQSWPMALRVNFDSAERVVMIFIYRSDL